MDTKEATELVEQFERAVIESQHKMATAANRYFVDRLRRQLIERLEKVQS